jgi:uncharacterized protein (TIRG00374 family)
VFETRGRSARVVISYGVAGALLWLFLRNAEWRVLVDGLRSVGWLLLGAAVLARLASLIVSAVRWQVLLAPVRHVPLGPLVATMMMGMAVSALVSMQAAEIARPYLLSKREGLDFRATVATIAVEWCLDLSAVLAFFIPVRGLMMQGADARPLDVNLAIVLLVLISVGSLVALRALRHRLGRVRSWIQASGLVPKRLRPGIADHVEQFAEGLQILESRKGLAAVAVCSLLAAFLVAVSAWLALLAFGLPVTFVSGFVILGLITIGGMIPTPGAIGGFHAVCQFGLMALLKLTAAQTVAPVIGLHAVLYVPAAGLGALLFLSARTGAPIMNEA